MTVINILECVQATDVKVHEVDFNPEFIARLIPKLDWSAAVSAAKELGQLPENLQLEVAEDYEQDEQFLRKAHR